MSGPRSWMLYGAAGHTGALIAQHAHPSPHKHPPNGSNRLPQEKRNTGPRAGKGRTAPAGIRNA